MDIFIFMKKIQKINFLKSQFTSLCIPLAFKRKEKNNVLASKLRPVNTFKGEKSCFIGEGVYNTTTTNQTVTV